MASNRLDSLFDDVLTRAIAEVRASGIDVYTFAFYHDHESAAVSVCADTERSSVRFVVGQNRYTHQYFAKSVEESDLEMAGLHKANVGRSLSLAEFEIVNAAYTDLGQIEPDDDFYLSMIGAVRRKEKEIVALARDPVRLLFCCSSAKAEVEYLWTADPSFW